MKTLFLSMFLMATTFAQQGANTGGGGSFSEVDLASNQEELKQTVSKIRKFFLKHAELSTTFPEVITEKLLAVTENVKIEVVSEELTDRNGIKGRTCLNNELENRIVCNNSELLKTNNNARLLFVLMFHEILGLLGVEETSPANVLVIDGYSVSKKLAPYVTKINNYDLLLEKETQVQLPDLRSTDEASMRRVTSKVSPFTEVGLKSAAMKKARMECLVHFEVCHVREETYKSNCSIEKRPDQYLFQRARSCTGTVIWKGEKPRTNTKGFYIDSADEGWRGHRKDNFQKVLNDAYIACRSAGYLLCTLAGHFQIKTQTGYWLARRHLGDTRHQSMALVIGHWPVNQKKYQVVQSDDFNCKEPQTQLEYDLFSCVNKGLKNCRVAAHRGEPSCKYLPSVVGDL